MPQAIQWETEVKVAPNTVVLVPTEMLHLVEDMIETRNGQKVIRESCLVEHIERALGMCLRRFYKVERLSLRDRIANWFAR
jgi:hypothetical protein